MIISLCSQFAVLLRWLSKFGIWGKFYTFIFPLFLPLLVVTWSCYVNVYLYACSMFALIRVGFWKIWGGPWPRLTLPLHKHTQECYLCSLPPHPFFLTSPCFASKLCLYSFSPAALLFLNMLTLFLMTFFFLSWTNDCPFGYDTISLFSIVLSVGMTSTSIVIWKYFCPTLNHNPSLHIPLSSFPVFLPLSFSFWIPLLFYEYT